MNESNRRFEENPVGHYEQLPLSEYAIALEFYLQIDGKKNGTFFVKYMTFEFQIFLVDLFYMKTCSFRGARPNLTHQKGLFCLSEPEIRYGMIQCQQKDLFVLFSIETNYYCSSSTTKLRTSRTIFTGTKTSIR